jgi:hypothetical protein
LNHLSIKLFGISRDWTFQARCYAGLAGNGFELGWSISISDVVKHKKPAAKGRFHESVPSALSGARRVEFGIERFGALDDGEFDGDAVLEMAHDLPTHGAEHDLDADRRLDVDLDRGAG